MTMVDSHRPASVRGRSQLTPSAVRFFRPWGGLRGSSTAFHRSAKSLRVRGMGSFRFRSESYRIESAEAIGIVSRLEPSAGLVLPLVSHLALSAWRKPGGRRGERLISACASSPQALA